MMNYWIKYVALLCGVHEGESRGKKRKKKKRLRVLTQKHQRQKNTICLYMIGIE